LYERTGDVRRRDVAVRQLAATAGQNLVSADGAVTEDRPCHGIVPVLDMEEQRR